MKLSKIKVNKANPRIIKDYKFKKLCNSIREFPKMLELRPIVVDTTATMAESRPAKTPTLPQSIGLVKRGFSAK